MSRTDDLLTEFARTHAELISIVRDCPDAVWREATDSEQWPVGMVAKHIALGYLQGRRWIETMVAGERVETSFEDIHRANEANRTQSPDSKSDTEAFLEKSYAKFVDTVRGLSDEDLDRSVYFGPREGEATVESVARTTPRHTRTHLDSIKATAGRSSDVAGSDQPATTSGQ